MKMSLQTIAEVLAGELCHAVGMEDKPISAFSINTRTLQVGEAYIAIQGQVFDGHDFIGQAIAAGASALIVAKPVDVSIPCIMVKDTHQALGQLASAWRLQSHAAIVGITGSNGKTTVKEMVAAILSVNAPVLYTQGNLNNDIGVPLTLLKLQQAHRYGVIEMGANHAGEIAYTSACAKADVVIITNVGDAHLEGFGSREGVAHAKGEIIATLKADGIAILNRDDDYYDYWQNLTGKRQHLSFGLNSAADFRAENIVAKVVEHAFCTQFNLMTPDAEIPITLNLAGRHNVMNALAASAAAVALGIPLAQIQQGLARLQPVKGRLQSMIGRLGNIIIDDTYNANPASLAAALAVLQDCPGEHWLALGAFGELGADSMQIHTALADTIKQYGVVRLFATGADTEATVRAFGVGAEYFVEQIGLINALNQTITAEVTLLIKGSRSQRMENVTAALTNPIGK